MLSRLQTRKTSHSPISTQPTLSAQDERLAQWLLKTYTEFKRRYSGQAYRNQLHANSHHINHFRRCALKIRGLQSRGYPVAPTRFIWIVFAHYGKFVYPSYFSSDKVWKLYFVWEEHRAEKAREGISFVDEENTLQFLCASRAEPLLELWPKIRTSEIFSAPFVAYMDQVVERAQA